MEQELKDIMEYDEAHYFGIPTEIELGGVITELTESSNPTESEKQYIHQKSKTVKVTGFSNEFPITLDMVKGDKVFEFMYDIFFRRKTGTDALVDHYIINLWQPTDEEGKKFVARKITQTCEIEECNGAAGEQKQITGSLKGGEFVYGEFDIATKTFTEKDDVKPYVPVALSMNARQSPVIQVPKQDADAGKTLETKTSKSSK